MNHQIKHKQQNIRVLKLKEGIKSAFVAIIGISILIGVAITVRSYSKNEPTGYYTAQDTLNAYNHGAENMREALEKEAQELTVRSRQE